MKYKILVTNPEAPYGQKMHQSFFSDIDDARGAVRDMVGGKDYKGCTATIYILSETLVESVNLDAPVIDK